MNPNPRTALITGGSSGLGLELVRSLTGDGWTVITDARHEERLRQVAHETEAIAVPGDVADADHRAALRTIVEANGGLDLLVLNASTLGPLPMRPLTDLDPLELGEVIRTNAGAQTALMILLADQLRRRDGMVLSISSDAAVEHYPTWGPYGASKAALDHLVLTFGEETGLATHAVDPGDMRTPMHQDAFPDEDISDRPLPATVVPHLRRLIADRPASGRHRIADMRTEAIA